MENVLWYSYFIVVYMDPLYGSTSCQNCLWQKCDARGICTEGCIAGYTDKYCQHPCQETCLNSSCDVELHSGRTVCRDGCVDGYCGIRCKIPCPEGCLTCDQSHCENCTLCRADLYGAKCEHSCLHKCDGFACNIGGACLERCLDGRYGANCNVSCHSNHQSCDRDTGQCQQCKAGYFGNVCQHLCPSCLTTEEEQFYTCRSGCKVCSSQSTAETQQSCQKQSENKTSQEIATTLLVFILVLVTTAAIIIIIIRVIRVIRVMRHKHRKSRRNSSNAERTELLEGGGADFDLQTPDTDLIAACKEGKLQGVRDILDQSLEDINKKDCGGMTPVMWAARRGHREVLDLLLKKEADVSLKDKDGHNILHWACYGCNFAMVKYVLSLGKVDINNKGLDGRTPAMFVALQGYMKLFQLLVSKGGFPSEVDNKGNNVLLLACWGGNVKIVKYIISYKTVDINGTGQSGRTPLMAAAYWGNEKVVDLLVKEGADLTRLDAAGDNVLHVACLGGYVDIVKRVVDLVDISSPGQYNRTPLMMAARRGEKEIFDLLVKKEAALCVDDDGNNILHLASEGGHLEIVKYVLENMDISDINARNKHNETATMLAPRGGEVSHLLVSGYHGLMQ